MRKLVIAMSAASLMLACEKTQATESPSEGGLQGPFPKTIRGTVDSSYPIGGEGSPIKLIILGYDDAAFLVSEATYDEKGMESDDAEVSLTIEPVPLDQCGDGTQKQCFRAY